MIQSKFLEIIQHQHNFFAKYAKCKHKYKLKIM